MILESLVTTLEPDGSMHLAPMGPRVAPDWSAFVLRPFQTSETFRNLKTHGEGVVHVTDDVLLLAKSSVGHAAPPPARKAERVKGYVLTGACRFYEFVVRTIDESQERAEIEVEVVHRGAFREFFGLNRAKHAVVEAAILATRLLITSASDVRADYRKLRTIVEKTGGPAEHEAFAFLDAYVKGAVSGDVS